MMTGRKLKDLITAYLFLIPSFIAISLFVFVPLFFSFIMSLFENPSVVNLRFAFKYYTDFSHLWWRNLRDFFVASTGDDIGILRDEGIFLIIYILVLIATSILCYKLLRKHTSKISKPIPSFFIAGLSVLISVIMTPIMLNITILAISVLPTFIKLPIEGYREVLTSSRIEFFRILFNTVFWTVTCVFLHVALGMVLAILMNKGGSSAQGLFRGVFILPWAIPSFVSALVWRAFIFNRRQGILGQITASEDGSSSLAITLADILGLIVTVTIIIILFLYLNNMANNRFHGDSISKYLTLYIGLFIIFLIGIELGSIFGSGLNKITILTYKVVDIPSINSTFWFTDDIYLLGIHFKMMTFSAIITNVWLGVPFMMVSFLAALQSIPQDLYEAADIDGAGVWSKFRNITLPLLKPTLMTVSLLGVIWTFNLFNIFYILSQNQTGLGDRTNYDIFVTFIYEQFNQFQYNAAAALSFTVFIMLVSFSLVYRRLMKAEAIFEGE